MDFEKEREREREREREEGEEESHKNIWRRARKTRLICPYWVVFKATLSSSFFTRLAVANNNNKKN
jgi:hypothetical protein